MLKDIGYQINNDLVQSQIPDWEDKRFNMGMAALREKCFIPPVDEGTSHNQIKPKAIARFIGMMIWSASCWNLLGIYK